MPVMMRMETLQTPPKLPEEMDPDPNASMLNVKVNRDLSLTFNDGVSEKLIQASDLVREMRPKLESLKDKVVFVDFDREVLWKDVVGTMDTIRSLASDVANHDEIKVALKIKDDDAPAAPGQPGQ